MKLNEETAGRQALRCPRSAFTVAVNTGLRVCCLVLAGVALRTVAEFGGGTLAMIQRYADLAPGHLTAAVEWLTEVCRFWTESERRERGGGP